MLLLTYISARYLRCLLVLAALIISSVYVLSRSSVAAHNPEYEDTNTGKRLEVQTEANSRKTIKADEKSTDDNKPHLLAGSYYTLRDGFASTLLLNNKGPKPLEVRPTLFNLEGQRIDITPVTIESNSFRLIDIREWAIIGGGMFDEGSLQIFHRGKDLVLGSQIYITNDARSLSFDEKLKELTGSGATRLEGVWWLPSSSTDVRLILSNTSDAHFTVTTRIAGTKRRQNTVETYNLQPHETRAITVQHDFVNSSSVRTFNLRTRSRSTKSGKNDGFAEAASITHTGADGALLARAMVQDERTGYSSTVQFSNPQGGKTTQYHGAGLRVGSMAGEPLSPVMVARNVGDVTSVIKSRLPYTTPDSKGVIALPDVRLAPGEIKFIDLQHYVEKSRSASNILTAGLELDYTGAPGSVIVAAHSVSANGNQVFRVPLWDPLVQRSPTGGYPWYIEGDSSTTVFIKNITPRQQDYVAFLILPDNSQYMIGMKQAEPHQTVEVDLRALRDNQVPDENGKTIPLNVTHGQFQWSLRLKEDSDRGDPFEQIALIGRSEQVDAAKAISSNYACENCCVGNFVGGRISPNSVSAEVGGPGSNGQYRAYETEENCYTTPYEHTVNASWRSSNTSVATVDGSGNVTGQGPGSTTITASWGVNYTYVYPCSGGGSYGATNEQVDEEDSGGIQPLAPPCGSCRNSYSTTSRSATHTLRPKITGATNVWWFNGETPSGYATQVTLEASPGASSYQWSVVAGADKVTLSNSNTNQVTVTGANKSAFQEVSVQVDVNGAVSSPFKLSVRAPHRLVLNSDFKHFADNTFGYLSYIHYRIEDQFTDLLPYPVEVNERFTTSIIYDYPGTNWTFRSGETGLLISPVDWADQIGGQDTSFAFVPTPTNPCRPNLCNVKVEHWEGEWYVGSALIGRGVRVQTNRWQKYADHAEHHNRISPITIP